MSDSREIVQAALRGTRPDRVPVVEFLVDESVARKAVPDCRDVADCMDRLGFDNVGCGAEFRTVEPGCGGGPPRSRGSNHFGMERGSVPAAGPGERRASAAFGTTFVDEWGVTYQRNAEAVAHPLRGPIATMKDARAYTPPNPDAEHRLAKLRDLVSRYKGRRAIIFHHRAAFMWSAYLMGIENILMGFLTEPELVELVMDKTLEVNMGVVRNAIRAGAEVIVLGDDYAHNTGPLMSREVFAQFIKPRLAKMIAMIHEEGAFCIKHTDGNIYDLLDDILDCEPDGLNPIEPVAGMDLKTAREKVGPKLCLVGNIDCAHLLPHGTEDEVRAAVKQAIADADGGPHMISSSNSVHSSCKAENLVAMVEAVRRSC